jgi:DNA-binding transcriptional ArsR family regulator
MADLDLRLTHTIGHPMRQRLMLEYADGVTSPSRIAAAIGERLNLVSYHTHVLLKAGMIELVRTEPRRGAREHFYRAVGLGDIEDAEWAALPLVRRRALVRRLLEQVWRDADRALPQGGMDERATHVSRTVFTLDEQGRVEIAALLRRSLQEAGRIDARSRAREAADGRRWELAVLYFSRSRP